MPSKPHQIRICFEVRQWVSPELLAGRIVGGDRKLDLEGTSTARVEFLGFR